MGAGILVCGLNSAGKSTLGKALAEQLGVYFLDNEDLYFPKTDPAYLYAPPRTREEVEQLLWKELRTHENLEAVPIGDGMQIGEKNFLSGKEETRRNPDGFQEFLTQPDETFSVKIRAGAYWYSFFVFAAVKGDYGDALYPFSGAPF
jgi:hypothetical protein